MIATAITTETPILLTYSLTDKGWAWVLENQSRFMLNQPAPQAEDEIPF